MVDLTMKSIDLSEDGPYKLDVSFDYKLSGTGLDNCKDLVGTYQLHAVDPEMSYEQKSFTDDEITDSQLSVQTQVQTIDEVANCWYVTVTYGEEAHESRWATASSQ